MGRPKLKAGLRKTDKPLKIRLTEAEMAALTEAAHAEAKRLGKTPKAYGVSTWARETLLASASTLLARAAADAGRTGRGRKGARAKG